ncbi:YvcK family protein, partial [Candidatus Dojkabacteria bacterium]|nr:YvcK family protein [Candidatus Dojkabacteria bacterium]
MPKKVAVIGGGTGTVAVLSGLKYNTDVTLSAIVNMTDDGGSNRVVRDEFGLLPLSDLRKSIVALADAGNGIFRELFTYRFDKGEGLSSHTLGNLMLMALSDITGSEIGAIEAASKIFNCRGKVIPVTLDDVRLVAKYDDG